MDLTDEDIREFIELWKEEFGEDISPAYARQRATEVLELYLRLAEPLPAERAARTSGESRTKKP